MIHASTPHFLVYPSCVHFVQVTDARAMFKQAASFHQNLSSWVFMEAASQKVLVEEMFDGAVSFDLEYHAPQLVMVRHAWMRACVFISSSGCRTKSYLDALNPCRCCCLSSIFAFYFHTPARQCSRVDYSVKSCTLSAAAAERGTRTRAQQHRCNEPS